MHLLLRFIIVYLCCFCLTTNAIAAYCNADGDSSADEWIQSISLNTINNNSGNDNGYGNYTNFSTSLAKGGSYNMTLEPGYRGENFTEYWRVWIDYNQDDDFNDNGELVYDSDGGYEGLLNISFQIRSTVNTGNTRMRVAMKWVGNFDDGTSDYTAPSFERIR